MRAVVVVPTYDEVSNLAPIVARLRTAQPDVDVLVVDDASPDGTGALADELTLADARVHVLHRAQKRGLGKAYLDGFAWALAQEYDVVGQMDADGSHQPEQLGLLLAALHDTAAPADVVIGSRWVRGGSIANWSVHRELLSRGGNLYTRALLGIPVRDATSGFRLSRRTALERMDLQTVASSGYVFQVDLVVRAVAAGLRVVEVPIEFLERERGDSKMDAKVAVESLRRITAWGLSERRRQVAGLLRRSRRGTRRRPDTLDRP
jgi:dolichol-phosphate mannosyltransferase